jgi:hypothetical protein
MAKSPRGYSAKLKFQVVLEALKGNAVPGRSSQGFRVQPNSVGIWKHRCLGRGPSVFERVEAAEESNRPGRAQCDSRSLRPVRG